MGGVFNLEKIRVRDFIVLYSSIRFLELRCVLHLRKTLITKFSSALI